MRAYSRALVVVIACLAGSGPAVANAQISRTGTCPVENAQVSASFTGMDTDVAAVKSKLNAKIAEIKSLAQEQNFAKLVLQSYNYNISTSYNAGGGGEQHLQYNANVAFVALPADKAVAFMQLLAKKGYQTSVNVSSFDNGNCTVSPEG